MSIWPLPRLLFIPTLLFCLFFFPIMFEDQNVNPKIRLRGKIGERKLLQKHPLEKFRFKVFQRQIRTWNKFPNGLKLYV